MAILGEIIVFLLGLGMICSGGILLIASTSFGCNREWLLFPVPVCIGGYLIYLAVHYGPITISFGG